MSRVKITVEGWRPYEEEEKKSGVAIDTDTMENPECDFIHHLRGAFAAILSHEMRRLVDHELDSKEIQMDRTALYEAVGCKMTGHEISFPGIGNTKKKKPKPGTIQLEILREE